MSFYLKKAYGIGYVFKRAAILWKDFDSSIATAKTNHCFNFREIELEFKDLKSQTSSV